MKKNRSNIFLVLLLLIGLSLILYPSVSDYWNCFHQSRAIANYAVDLDRYIGYICEAAQEHGKVAALTETGYEGLKTADWWTRTLVPVLGRHPVSYVLVWRNAHDKPGHFYAPYPGQESAADFVTFYNDGKTLFLHDLNEVYTKNE